MRLLEILRILIDAGQTRDCIDIVRIVFKDVFECLYRKFGVLVIVGATAARNELLRVGSTEIDLGGRQIRIEFTAFLKNDTAFS